LQQAEPNLGGIGLGISALFGVGRRLSVEGEVSRGASLDSTWQEQVGSEVSSYSVTYRDTLVSAFVRWHADPGRRIVIEPVGGVTLAFGRGTLASHVRFGPGTPTYSDTVNFSKTSLGLGGGVDVLVPIAAQVSIAGAARLHWLVWNDRHHFYPPEAEIGDWVLQLGGGVQVSWTRLPSPEARLAGQAKVGPSAKEPPPRRGYVGGTITVFHQPDGYADGHYLSAPLGGTLAGFSGIVGGFITRNLSLEAEVSVGPTLTAEQWFVNRTRTSTSYRDTLLSGFLRWHALRFARFAIEPVGGVTIAAGHAARTAVDYQTWYPYEPLGPPYDVSVTRFRFGAGGGADFVVPAGRNLAVTASFRLHALDRDDERDGPPELGIGTRVYQFGGGLQWRF
jgi:hypothetical protein